MMPAAITLWLLVSLLVDQGSIARDDIPSQESPQPVAGSEGLARAFPIQVGPDGRVYGLLRQDRRLEAFDPKTGKTTSVRLDFGELSPAAGYFGWVRDTLWVSSSAGQSVVLLDGAGRVARRLVVSLPRPVGELRSQRLAALLPGHRLLVRTTASLDAMAAPDSGFGAGSGRIAGEASPSGVVRELPLWLSATDGSVVRTVAALSTRNFAAVLVWPGGSGSGGRRIVMAEQPYGDFPLLAVSANGLNIVVVDRSVEAEAAAPTYRLLRIGPAGDTLMRREVPYVPVPMREDWVEREAALMGSGLVEDPTAAAAAAKARMFIPPWLPPVTEVLVDLDGWTWIAREVVPGAERRRWEVFSPEGDPVGTVDLPIHFRVRAVRREVAWAIDTREEEGRLWRMSVGTLAR